MDIGNIFTYGVNGMFYLAVGLFVLFLILLYINYNVKQILFFLPAPKLNDIPQIDTINSNTRLNDNKPEDPDTELVFEKIKSFKYEGFSVSFDVFLNGQYISTDVPRVLMYFDTAPVSILDNNALSEDSLLTVFGNSNFIVYCDKVKNDLIVAAITRDGTTRVLEKVATLENIPINDPFQITFIVTPNFFEVYKNKELIKTYKLQHTLDTTTPSSRGAKLFSPISFLRDTIKIGNVQYFDGPLRSDQVRYTTNTLKSKTFFVRNN